MFLRDAKNQNQILKELETEIKTNVTEFKNVKLDFLTIVLYGNFEKDLNVIILIRILLLILEKMIISCIEAQQKRSLKL